MALLNCPSEQDGEQDGIRLLPIRPLTTHNAIITRIAHTINDRFDQ